MRQSERREKRESRQSLDIKPEEARLRKVRAALTAHVRVCMSMCMHVRSLYARVLHPH